MQAPMRGASSNFPSFSAANPYPPTQTLEHLIYVYRRTLHLQPLPLFNIDTLRTHLTRAPEFLLWSFLALALTFSSHEFYQNKESEARKFYTQSAEEAVLKMAIEDIPRVEVIQSLCLLALRHIKEGKEAQACMTIGMTSRLQAFRTLLRNHSSEDGDSMGSRCHWSVCILENIFCPQLSPRPTSRTTPEYPPSAPLPPSLPTDPDLSDSETSPNDLGINAYYIQLISLWGETALYLHNIRSGYTESPWSPDSTYTKLNYKRNEYEFQLAECHLLRNVAFTKRSRTEILEHHEYWTPWISMQIITHASIAILNHPFIHLVALRGNRNVSQPRFFLQQAVDHALFHSGWVFRLIQACETLTFPIHDPLIAHLVAATATISWIFQFAKDKKIADNAREHLAVAETLLTRMATTWPHISHKLQTLLSLQSTTTTLPTLLTTISFQPTVFWDLLDPEICPTQPPTGPTTPGARMRVTTQFVHPLVEDDPPPYLIPSTAGTNSPGIFLPDAHNLEHLSLDELFGQIGEDELAWVRY
ncbi:hypothetical protein BO94DRAFT_359431 [Aspergillus sclerotioniger CBS 115572]|uniref:Xylanolytic transcriptional activator regulatory domain-containing protein n=1 Tax=Aspergillus sclerotioniger CBS 115572 TaxID=1450535 RepID=A0A317X4I2_9EURO|nr:hypothetical protein BO94DRAFT_359431 [Aspergillus sclerotioniger CBS 115572]PWY93101.1 hypothetical protein BO94DRAFT_359431 [Aspergillus sclerotioniger CBS 115572]